MAETPEQMFQRVAENVAAVDRQYDPNADLPARTREFYELMASLVFLPNSPTLMNAGRELQQLHACFVLPVEDSLESIFDAIKQTALIQHSGGGTGYTFSHLRPKGSSVKTTRGVASGPVSFLKVFDAATQAIKQGGTRRGANMGILRVDHPDIFEFIQVKQDSTAITNFNLSVAATDFFMEAVAADKEYDLVDPSNGKTTKRLKARQVFEQICQSAWQGGDPGLIFVDQINQYNPTPSLGLMEATNPCGELPLLPYEACVLGSINVSLLVREEGGKPAVDWERLTRVVHQAVHFLDNTIDATRYPLPQVEAMTKANRKIGVGIMGLAHLLIRLGIPYDSEQALALGKELMSRIQKETQLVSEQLAAKRGPFPNFTHSIFSNGPKRRHATLTTIAPTGTISIIANTSSGIEPIFALSYVREVLEGEQLIEVDPWFEKIAKKEGFDLKTIPDRWKRIFVTAHEIPPMGHLKMQAAFQPFTENAISKTINMPTEATVDQVKEIYLTAWRLKCKGITIYRDKSRPSQVLNLP